jgi:hypothetical protein
MERFLFDGINKAVSQESRGSGSVLHASRREECGLGMIDRDFLTMSGGFTMPIGYRDLVHPAEAYRGAEQGASGFGVEKT